MIVFSLLALACSGESDPGAPDAGVRFEQENRSPNSNPNDSDAGNTAECETNDDECEVAQTRCTGRDLEACVPDNSGCLRWEQSSCTGNEVCIDGACIDAPDCVDVDQDGYGEMCPAGADCNDNDLNVNPGAIETCDGVDNNCDQQVDEGYGIGAPCTSGMGACASNGFTQCAAGGMATECGAQPLPGDPEVCDGMDNDCDGVADNGGVCTFCTSDPNEPNNDINSSTVLAEGTRGWLAVCPGDVDFFSPTVVTGQTYRMTIKYPEIISDLKMDAYVNGVMDSSSDNAFSDDEGFQFTAQAGESYDFAIVNKEPNEGVYYARFSNVNDLACIQDDLFAPNYDINAAPVFLASWWTNAYICFGSSDWYRLEQITQGEQLIIDADPLGFVDLELYLWGDPDGDNSFEVLDFDISFSNAKFVSISAPYTGLYFYEVRAPGDFGAYETRFIH